MLRASSRILQNKGITHPTVLIDQVRTETNIRLMAAKADAAGAVFRPHFKTHQSALVGKWFHAAGVRHITVSSLDMAEHFADLGWRDITVALLHSPLASARTGRLAAHLHHSGGGLNLLVDDPGVAAGLTADATTPTGLWLKIDTGYGRTGIRWDDRTRLVEVLAECRGLTVVRGLLTHSGHSYGARGPEQVRAVYDESITRLRAARDGAGRTDLQLSFGDTPCCSLVDDLSACDEIRPGNFVFNDLMQLRIGACREQQLAAAVACPVIGVYPERRQLVVHGGAVHLSKEFLTNTDGEKSYGCLGTIAPGGLGAVLPGASLVSLSQEHGVVEFAPETASLLTGLVPGDLVVVWPVHSCLSCNLLRDQMAAPLTV